MRITIVMGFFLPVPPLAGGATEKIWFRLAQLMAAAGHEVTIISRRWPGLPDVESTGSLTHLRVPGMAHAKKLSLNLVLDFIWGLRVTRQLPPADLVVCNTVSLPAYLRFVRPSAGRVVAVLGRMPKGQTRVYGRVELLLATSEAVADRVRAENPRAAPRTRVFPNPIDWLPLAAAAAARAPHTNGNPLTIGYVGRIHPEKGLGVLLAAAAHLATSRPDLPPWRLELVGPWTIPQGGGGEAYRDSLLASYGPALGARLCLAGPEFDAGKLADRYAAMDIFCYPSLADQGETFGISVAEAMAAAVPPVVSGLACFRGLVTDDGTGLVFDHTADDAPLRLADGLARLLVDAPLRHELATRAQIHARRYDFAESARAVLEIFASVAPPQPK
jgi:glycosyltransferase involved in cell wall biosynthesis